MHFAATLGALLAAAWMGSKISDLLLLHLLLLTVLMLPGLHTRGLLKRGYSEAVFRILGAVTDKDKKAQ